MIHRIHMLNEAEHLVGVAVLVVVPAHDLDEMVVQGDAGGGEDGGADIVQALFCSVFAKLSCAERLQHRDIVHHRVPNDLKSDASIVVGHDVAHASDLAPVHAI